MTGAYAGALLALVLSGAAPATAARAPRHVPREVTVALSGSLAIVWAGRSAGRCATEDLCGVHGSLQITLGNSSTGGPAGSVPLEASDDSAAVRVQTTAADGTIIPCADTVPVDFVLVMRHTGGRLRAALDTADSFQLPSAGRCAGPTAADLDGVTLPARRERGGFDLSGQSSAAAGPFEVTAISTVRVRVTPGSQGGSSGFGGPVPPVAHATPVKPRPALQEIVRLLYRVTGFSGSIITDFSGTALPVCEALGTCGAAGQLTQSFATRGTLEFAGARLVRRRVGRVVALADLRARRLRLSDTFAILPLREAVTETFAQPGSSCRDGLSLSARNLLADRIRNGTDELLLRGDESFFGGEAPDPFRTRCAGPSRSDMGSAQTLAAATVTTRDLGAHHLTLTFDGSGAFASDPYAGRRHGSLVLSLTLIRARGGTRAVKLFPGEPGVTAL